ncbi:MAG: isochorismatase family protein [Acidobacteriota bacterium]|nr:isochorismatase family protein [Acidobacteriota bacterium]
MIFFDVDTQYDFMEPGGALYVPQAETVKPNLERLLRAAGELHVTTISSRCAHQPRDPEFQMFPPHCLEGTPGAERVLAEFPQLPRQEIAVDAVADADTRLEAGTHYVVKKIVFDMFSSKWLDGLRQRGAFRGEHCVVFGVATDYCVRCCVLGLVEAGAQVQVVEDAIRGVAPETTEQTFAEMRSAGVEFTTTDDVLKQLKGQAE